MWILTTQVSDLLNIAAPELCTPSLQKILSLYSPEKTTLVLIYWKKMISEQRKKKRNRHANIHSLLALVWHPGCSAAAVTATLSLTSSNKARKEATTVYETPVQKTGQKEKRERRKFGDIQMVNLELQSYPKWSATRQSVGSVPGMLYIPHVAVATRPMAKSHFTRLRLGPRHLHIWHIRDERCDVVARKHGR